MNSALRLAKNLRMCDLAKLDVAILSHPSFGPWEALDVLISTMSPVFNAVFNGTMTLLTKAPTAFSATLV